MSYYYSVDGQNIQGPAELSQIETLMRQSQLPPTFLICEVGGQEWKTIDKVLPAVRSTASQAASFQVATTPDPAWQPQAETGSAPITSAGGGSTGSVAFEAPIASSPSTAPASSLGVSATVASVSPSASREPAVREESPPAHPGPTRFDFAALKIDSDRSVNPKELVAKGTGFHRLIGLAVAGLGSLFLLGIYTFYLLSIHWVAFVLGLLIGGLLYWLAARKAHAHIHGSSLHVTADQFPEIYHCTHDFARRLGMKSVPEVYIIEGSVLNAFAAKVGGRKYMLLLDDIIHGCMRAGEAKALSFVIAHELAHHALGHTGMLRGAASTIWKNLSRLDELSCDAVAAGLVEDNVACAKGLGLFLVGPELVGHVDWKALDSQASHLLNKERWKAAEGSLSHPLLLRRYAAIRGFGR